MLKSIIGQVEIRNNFLLLSEDVQEKLDINKYSQIKFVLEKEGVSMLVLNPKVITVERQGVKKQWTIIRNDFICPNCHKPILYKRSRRNFCSIKCAKQFQIKKRDEKRG